MPIYEFLCRACNRIFSFHSFKVTTEKVPTCPKCGATDLHRVPSRFGVASSKAGADGDDDGDGLDDPRVEREMMRFASELENMDENDPRAMAAAVRRMTEIAGEPVTPAMSLGTSSRTRWAKRVAGFQAPRRPETTTSIRCNSTQPAAPRNDNLGCRRPQATGNPNWRFEAKVKNRA
jgi:putative FmdB family regulatory protein